MAADSQTTDAMPVIRLRWAMGIMTVVLVVAFIAVGAVASIVVFAVVGGALTALLRPGRTLVIVLAGLAGAVVAALAVPFLTGDGPSGFGDYLFVYVGGLLGLAVLVLAVMALTGARRG